MRLELDLECKPNSTIGLNYLYVLQAIIYKVLERADPVFSQWLHSKGYDSTGRNFKFFNFDFLRGFYVLDKPKNTIRFPEGKISWQISFCVDEPMEKFVIGLFKDQTLEVVTREGRADFHVKNINALEKLSFTSTTRFRTLTPVCISEDTVTDKHPQFRSPLDKNFEMFFFNNLENKFREIHSIPRSSNTSLLTPHFKLLSEPYRKKYHTVKNRDEKPIDTIGYEFDFEITAPPEFLRIGYYAGFGVKNASGFGFCEILK